MRAYRHLFSASLLSLVGDQPDLPAKSVKDPDVGGHRGAVRIQGLVAGQGLTPPLLLAYSLPRAGLTRAAVVDVAPALVDEKGAEALSLAVVADRAGAAAPSLYKPVGSLAELRERMAERVIDELHALSPAEVMGRNRDDAVAVLMRAVRAYVVANPGRYGLVPPVARRDDTGGHPGVDELGRVGGVALLRDAGLYRRAAGPAGAAAGGPGRLTLSSGSTLCGTVQVRTIAVASGKCGGMVRVSLPSCTPRYAELREITPRWAPPVPDGLCRCLRVRAPAERRGAS